MGCSCSTQKTLVVEKPDEPEIPTKVDPPEPSDVSAKTDFTPVVPPVEPTPQVPEPTPSPSELKQVVDDAPPASAAADMYMSAPDPPQKEQSFELTMPEGCTEGDKLHINLPGVAHGVIVTVPEGAVPGELISFKLTGQTDVGEAAAAIAIQSRIRGRSVRKVGYKPKGHAAPPNEGAAEQPSGQQRFDPANYPSLAPPTDADADDATPTGKPVVYRPKGAAAPPLPSAAPTANEKPTHDPELYPSLATGATTAAPPMYKPRGYAAPPQSTPPEKAHTHDASLYPSLAAADEGAVDEAASGSPSSGVETGAAAAGEA